MDVTYTGACYSKYQSLSRDGRNFNRCGNIVNFTVSLLSNRVFQHQIYEKGEGFCNYLSLLFPSEYLEYLGYLENRSVSCKRLTFLILNLGNCNSTTKIPDLLWNKWLLYNTFFSPEVLLPNFISYLSDLLFHKAASVLYILEKWSIIYFLFDRENHSLCIRLHICIHDAITHG